MSYKLNGAWLMSLANYFIKNYDYKLVSVTQNNDEMWLVNPQHDTTPVIVISTLPTQNFDTQMMGQHREALALAFNAQAKGLNISVNPESVTHSDYTVFVGAGTSSDSPILLQFNGVRDVLKKDANPDYTLAKALFDLRRTLSSGKSPLKAKPPLASWAMIGVMLIMYALTIALAGTVQDLEAIQIMSGAFYKPLIVSGHEWWRLLSGGFVHLNIFHLLLSVMIVQNLGNVLERHTGWRRFLVIFLGGILVSNLTLFITEDIEIGLGLSGAISALIGYLAVFIVETKLYRSPRYLGRLLSTVFSSVLFLLLPGASMTGVVASLAFGTLCGLAFSKRQDWHSLQQGMRWIIMVYCLALVGIASTRMVPIHNPELEIRVIESWQSLGFADYAQRLQRLLP